MKTVALTAGVLSKLHLKNGVTTWSQRSASYISSLNRNVANQSAGAATSVITNKRFITSDSWGAAGLMKKGEILTSADHKENIEVDAEYMEGKPPAEVIRICNEMLKLNVVQYYALMNNVMERIGMSDQDLLEGIAARRAQSGGGGGSSEEVVEVVAAEPVKEKEFFDIKLTAVDPKSKIKIIKEVRALTGLGLKEAKDLVEKAPVVIKQGIKKEELDAMKKILLDVGAEIEII